jgi:hypothetical protein
MNHADYEQKLFDFQIDYYPVQQFISKTTKIEHECLKGHIFLAAPSDILRGRGCNICNRRTPKTTEEYNLEISSKGYVAIEPYKTNKTKIEHLHVICGNTWKIKPNDIISGYGCPYCSKSAFKGTEKYKVQLREDFEVLEEYKGALVPILHRHKVCGYERLVRPSDMLTHLDHNNCPNCAKYGINLNHTTYLYCVQLINENTVYYKVGITNKPNIEDRFGAEWQKYSMKLLWKTTYSSGIEAKKEEQSILEDYKMYKANISVLSTGNTEILTKYVLEPS